MNTFLNSDGVSYCSFNIWLISFIAAALFPTMLDKFDISGTFLINLTFVLGSLIYVKNNIFAEIEIYKNQDEIPIEESEMKEIKKKNPVNN